MKTRVPFSRALWVPPGENVDSGSVGSAGRRRPCRAPSAAWESGAGGGGGSGSRGGVSHPLPPPGSSRRAPWSGFAHGHFGCRQEPSESVSVPDESFPGFVSEK